MITYTFTVPGGQPEKKIEAMSLKKAHKEWWKWLKKCPVPYTFSRHPTSYMEAINFDFSDYDSEEE